MRNKTLKYVAKSSEPFLLNKMKIEKANGFFKRGVFTNELVWGNYSYVSSHLTKAKQKKFQKGLYIFGMVRRDAKLFIKENPSFKLPKKYGQIEYNKDLNEDLFGKITATDLNHAYWRIAYNLGIISDMTYEKGLSDDFKELRLAALSTMGATKTYQKIVKGELTNQTHIIKGDEVMQNVYKLIRYTCYRYMTQVQKRLGKDFLCYKTDCIYYIDTRENRKIVTDFFKEKDLLMKQLV
jgi:hypothetical protein